MSKEFEWYDEKIDMIEGLKKDGTEGWLSTAVLQYNFRTGCSRWRILSSFDSPQNKPYLIYHLEHWLDKMKSGIKCLGTRQ